MADQQDPGANTYNGREYTGEYKGSKAGTTPSNVRSGGFSAAVAGAKKFRNQRPDEPLGDYIREKKKFLESGSGTTSDDAAAALAQK